MLINSSNIQKENLNIKSSTELLNDRYIILEKIDDGLTSKVFKVLDTFSNEIKVAKIFDNNLFWINIVDLSYAISYDFLKFLFLCNF